MTSKVVEVMDKELHGEDKVIKEVNRGIGGVELVAWRVIAGSCDDVDVAIAANE